MYQFKGEKRREQEEEEEAKGQENRVGGAAKVKLRINISCCRGRN